MQKLHLEKTLSLMPRQLVSIRLAQYRTIRVVCGQVWLTVEADANDYWLTAGDTLGLAHDRHIVIEAGAALSKLDILSSCGVGDAMHANRT